MRSTKRGRKKLMIKNDIEEKKKAAQKDPEESAKAYDRWFKMKAAVERKQAKAYEEYQEEEDRQYKVRDKEQCRKAYQCWLKRKSREQRMMQEDNEKMKQEALRVIREVQEGVPVLAEAQVAGAADDA